ncbi:hypothetical protein ACX6XY_14685 [Streptomyces sp. O3]
MNRSHRASVPYAPTTAISWPPALPVPGLCQAVVSWLGGPMFPLLAFFLALVVFGVAVVGVLAALVALLAMLLPNRRQPWPLSLLRRAALLVGCLGAALYAVCVMWLGMAVSESTHGASSSPSPSCRGNAPVPLERVVDYEVWYVPLGFDCVLDDGTTYPSGEIADWYNGIIALCAVAVVLLLVGAHQVRERYASRPAV